ncbi:MAG: conjugal transfer protein TraF [Candidatus Thiodiazotropha sp.]
MKLQTRVGYRVHKKSEGLCSLIGRLSLLILVCFSAAAHSMPFGALDSRSVAMGKTGVALIGSTDAAYFNPALLAGFSERKGVGKNQRIAMPTLSVHVSDNALELVDIKDMDYEAQLNGGVAEFNNNLNADALANALDSLDGELGDISSDALFADVQANVNFRIPDRHEGGAFRIGRRAVLDGRVDYTEDDKALIADYLEEMRFIDNGGTPATLHPELYANGQLIDPQDNLTSAADAVALIIDELAVSMGWAVNWWGYDMMVGITPKVIRTTTYEYTAAAHGGLTKRGEYQNDVNINFDLGWAKRVGEKLTLGLSLKDLLPQDYRTQSNRYIKVRPQARVGGVYDTRWGRYAIDLDLLESPPLLNGDPTQELGIGGEWEIKKLQIRTGMVANLAATGENSSPMFTVGLRFQRGFFYSDLSYGRGKNQKSAAVQMGLRF